MSLFPRGIFYTLSHSFLSNFFLQFLQFFLKLKVLAEGFRVAFLFGKKVAARCDFSKVRTLRGFI